MCNHIKFTDGIILNRSEVSQYPTYPASEEAEFYELFSIDGRIRVKSLANLLNKIVTNIASKYKIRYFHDTF